MERVYTSFLQALALGQYNEKVIAHEFAYRGKPLIDPPPGKHPYDFYLPDGRSVEIKIDVRSQCTGRAALEYPTIKRAADFVILTTTAARVFTREEIDFLYLHGKVPAEGFGEQHYDGRLVSFADYYQHGTKLYQFIDSL